jgi:hypothetical protein
MSGYRTPNYMQTNALLAFGILTTVAVGVALIYRQP